ncbi:hypothetical protein JOD14_000828 [Enterococcus lemanii]|nr:hypothetical protein [Enterococcus lemanii]
MRKPQIYQQLIFADFDQLVGLKTKMRWPNNHATSVKRD